jgi:hypothetical protein
VPDQTRRLDYMRITEIGRAVRNPKNHDAAGIDASMKKFGIVEVPTLDERTGRLVAGHGRLDSWQAAAAKGELPPAGVQLAEDGEWMVPVLRGWTSTTDAEADAYLATSNKLVETGGWDDPALARFLDDLNAADPELMKITGFDDVELNSLLRHTDTLGGPATTFLDDLARQPFGPTDHPAPQGPPETYWPPQAPSDGPPADDDFDQGDPAPVPPPPADTPYGPQGTAAEYAPMSWVFHTSQRAVIRAALKHALKEGGLATSADALTAVCQQYLDANDVTVEQPVGAEA